MHALQSRRITGRLTTEIFGRICRQLARGAMPNGTFMERHVWIAASLQLC